MTLSEDYFSSQNEPYEEMGGQECVSDQHEHCEELFILK